jgi:protein O-mannosyl-transferase
MSRRPFAQHSVAALVLLAAIAIAYRSALDAGLVVDSQFIIARADRVHAATWANIVEIATTDYWWPWDVGGVYRPVTTLSYLFNWAVLGNEARPLGYVAVNLALHWLNAILLYALARRLLGLASTTSLAVALLFALHPVATESVTNVVGRADLLAAASVFSGLLLYHRAVSSARGAGRLLSFVAFAWVLFFGLLCKESALVLVAGVVLYDLIFRLDAAGKADASGTVTPGTPRRLRDLALSGWIALLPPLAAVALIRAWVFRNVPPPSVDFGENALAYVDFWTARWTALKAIGVSFSLLAWPSRLCPDYSVNAIPLFGGRWTEWEDARACVSAVGVVAAVALAVRLRRRAPAASFFVGFTLAALLPTSNLFFPIGAVLAERFLYLPLAGFSGCLVLSAEVAIARLPGVAARRGLGRALALGALAVVAVVYGARTARRNLDWRDEPTLWAAAHEACPESFRSHEGLSAALDSLLRARDPRAPDLDRVIALEESAVTILEDAAPPGAALPPVSYERLGLLYARKAAEVEADPARAADASAWAAKAESAIQRAVDGFRAENDARRVRTTSGGPEPIAMESPSARLFDHLGLAALQAGRPEPAIEAFAEARARAPGDALLNEHLATAQFRAGRPRDALLSVLQATLLAPERADLGQGVHMVYRQVDPGGCAFSLVGGRLEIHPECDAAREWMCAAYQALAATTRAIARGNEAEHAQLAERYLRAAEPTFRCSERSRSD